MKKQTDLHKIPVQVSLLATVVVLSLTSMILAQSLLFQPQQAATILYSEPTSSSKLPAQIKNGCYQPCSANSDCSSTLSCVTPPCLDGQVCVQSFVCLQTNCPLDSSCNCLTPTAVPTSTKLKSPK